MTIDPPPAATVTRHGKTLIAGVSGGDGHAIAAHWRFSDGSTDDGLQITRRSLSGLTGTVTVVDGAGDAATTQLP